MEISFSEQELSALRKEYADSATDEQFTLWIEDCKRRGLLPNRDIVLQIRSVKEWDAEAHAKVFKKKAIYITTIGAFRKIAERTGKYAGQLPSKWIYLDDNNQPTVEAEVPLPDGDSTDEPRQPWAVKVSVLRKGFDAPMTVVARFSAYAQTYKDEGKTRLNSTWSTRGPEQLEKCAEALALRKAFPDELAGLSVAEEFGKDEQEEYPAPAAAAPAVEAPKPIVAPKVDNTPAQGVEAPRPGEEKKSRRKKAEKKAEEPASQQEEEDKPNAHGVTITDEDLPENMRKGAVPPPAENRSLPTAVAEALGEPEDFEEKPQAKAKEEKPAAKAAKKDDDRAPNAEEKAGISTRLKALKQDSAMLRAFVLNFTGANDTKSLTLGQWNAVLDHLDAAAKAGTIDKVVGGGK